MADNRPRGREKNITGTGKSVYRRGSGLGTGPVGSPNGYGTTGSTGNSQQRSTARASGGKGRLIIIIAVLALIFGGRSCVGLGGSGLSSILGSGSDNSIQVVTSTPKPVYDYSQPYTQPSSFYPSSSSSSSSASSYSSLLNSLYGSVNSGSVSSGWDMTANTGKLNTKVDKAARPRYTTLFGNGADTATVMVYMCGTDLESQSGMATSDLNEMAKATLGDNVNVIIYTGGCRSWRNSIISSSTNQIYQLTKGSSGNGFKRLVDNAGNVSMTKPSTLSDFIQYCNKNFPANRNMLIFWDHGGGSLSGYGYDQKFSSSGSMTLKDINEALRNGGVQFDFIGFDACLMATTETALMLSPYADYMIASEETEPGVGWYYTNWVSELSKNPSIPTVQLGKRIVDDFVDACASSCRGQATTLALIDLAELQETLPADFKAFSIGTTELIEDGDYKIVSDARSGAREFSTTKIDQVDLVHLAHKIGSDEASDLVDTLLSAIKYNRTSSNMTNAYGLSIYFPYRKVSSVDSAVSTYEAIGISDEYSKCIQAFASVETGGQAMSGGSSSPYGSLFDYYSNYGGYTGSSSGSSSASSGSSAYDIFESLFGGYGSGSSSGSYGSYGSSYGYGSGSSAYSSDALTDMLGSLLGGNMFGISGLDSGNSGYLGRSLGGAQLEETAQFLSENRLDPTAFVWTEGADGTLVMKLTEDQWSLVHELVLNLFLDDGQGFIDMGLDNSFEFTDDGALIGQYDGTWTAIDGQPVAYYHVNTVDDGENYTITGRVPCLLNGERSELILVFDNDHPYGFIAGARRIYVDGETDTIAKGMTALEVGDTIDFLCDYYSYDGQYLDSYMLGDQMVVQSAMEDMEISYVYVPMEAARATYRFTDIYAQEYWSPVLAK